MNDMIINAEPNKELFIEMLTRDVTISSAIIDLIDNSVDGAKRISQNSDYSGLWVKIRIDQNSFRVEDNCGGFSSDLAKNHAFNFGHKKGYDQKVEGGVGNFGVGMKRTFFKLGREFFVESTTLDEHFTISQDIEKWKEHDNWTFKFDSLDTDRELKKEESPGTTVKVQKLRSNVSKVFSNQSELDKLATDIQKALSIELSKGLKVYFNDLKLEPIEFQFLCSDQLAPVQTVLPYKTGGGEVTITVRAGVSTLGRWEAGWYVFCNDRLVLKADQTEKTGWNNHLPKFHTDFAYFRGYVFFQAKDPDLLPWATHKGDVDLNASVYRVGLKCMKKTASKVLSFLRECAKERRQFNSSKIDSQPKNDLLKDTNNQKSISHCKFRSEFVVAIEDASITDKIRIQFDVDKEQFDEMMDCTGADSRAELGRIIFDYYFGRECE